MSEKPTDRARRIPRSRSDQYAPAAVDERRRRLEGMQGEKWANALDYLCGRGRHVAAEATIAREALAGQLRADAQSMHQAWLGMVLAKVRSAGLGIRLHAANGVATVGGGTQLPTGRACLELLGCVGRGAANRLAEIAAATCLAGELSAVVAIVPGEFVGAHQSLGRTRSEPAPAAD